MKKKIAIIGGGLFGITTYLILKRKGFECSLFEKNKDVLMGASTNNLNRVHLGYHYPRDYQTARQSLKGYKSFKKFYSPAIIKNFKNYYFIANSSKVTYQHYLKFCKKNHLKYKTVNLDNFSIKNQNLQGGIQVTEPIYDWHKIKIIILKKLKKLKKNDIKLNEKVTDISLKNQYILKTSKNSYNYDIIIDAAYEGSNYLSKKIIKPKKFVFQKVIILEFVLSRFKKMGLALMDGNFFSYLPKGKSNKHILYHVTYSVLKKKISKFYPKNWNKNNISKFEINKLKKNILNDIRFYFPNLKIKFTNNIFTSARVFPVNLEKTDKRISKVFKIRKEYYKILSAKVDHCVDISHEILQNLEQNK